MAYLLKKRGAALHIPKKKIRMTMATFLLSSVKSCEGSHGLRHHLLEKRGPPLLVLRRRVVTMVIFLHTSVESCGDDYGISSREEGGLAF